jgi:hypothetical protein
MKASEIVQELPEKNTPEREAMIISHIGLGHYLEPNMVEIESRHNGHVALIRVMSDALMLGDADDFLRVNATMNGEQCIADLLQMSLVTTKIADLIRTNASVLIEPCTQTPDAQMAYTSRMVKHSKAVTDSILHALQGTPEKIELPMIATGLVGIVADVGKDWVLSNKLAGNQSLAANYGWHTKVRPNPSAPQNGPYKCPAGGYMWQTLGTAHNTAHVDYSQVVRLMSRNMTVDSRAMTFEEVASDPELCGLVSYEGPLTVFRHPEAATVDAVQNS